jgi:hypothetical protein
VVSATKTVSIFSCSIPIILSTPENEILAFAERQNNKGKSDIIIDFFIKSEYFFIKTIAKIVKILLSLGS